MLSDSQDGRTLINEAAYAVIHEKAPNELIFYVDIRDRYLNDPEHFLAPPEAEDEPLAFGPGIPLDTISQVVFPILTPLLTLLVNEAIKAMGKDMGTEAITWVRSLFNKTPPPVKPDFTQQQLAAIMKACDAIAESEARRLNLKKSEVKMVRDALVARLGAGIG